MENDPGHIGDFIRAEVFPPGMTVTAAAKLLKIGRPRLSMVLNGRARLSSGLAKRMEAAFGFPAEDLMNRQSFRKEEDVKRNDAASVPVGSYVPPFLQVRASQIEKWASGIEARARLAVLLRTLVNSTGSGLTKVDFPGNDDSQRKGWDGFVEADKARPWVPEGTSGWEFGCSKDVKRKADGDFGKRTRDFSSEEREDVTFVFATPRRWAGKNDWEQRRRAEKQWKDVRVFDASDLEQWMEQSIPAQAWFANETGVPNEGVLSLEACWNEWKADCEPALAPALFEQALNEHKNKVLNWLAGEPAAPLTMSADSSVEALAFLHVLFSGNEFFPQGTGDKVVVFRKSGIVPKIVTPGSDMIAVSMSLEIERELASRGRSVRTILVYPRKVPYAVEPYIDLKPLNPFNFAFALGKMGCTRDEVNRLSRESGFSLTVLRRRLSRRPAVRTPDWAGNEKHARSLIAAMLAGTWDTDNPADRILVSELAGGDPYEEMEREIRGLLSLDDSPVISFGVHLGVKSKVDALFAVKESVIEADIKRFFEVAELVVTEDNPALDLSDDKQWMANLYGKSREVSDMLRQSVIDSFVLLAVHGVGLFSDRRGFEIQTRVRNIIKKSLSPLTGRKLESQKDVLPAYAEADPEIFLDIIEEDVKNEKPEVLNLFRPMDSSFFKSPPRSELLWALESLAWSGEHLSRTVDVLARLAERETKDIYINSSMNSLKAIFQPCAPQTSASVDKRIFVFNRLLEKFPDIGWQLCVEQFLEGPKPLDEYSRKPKWRTDCHGHGEFVSVLEDDEFVLNAFNKAVSWSHGHTEGTLADLVRNFENIPTKLQPEIWRLIENWRKKACDDDKARLRETIRVSGCHHLASCEMADCAREAYQALEPSDLVLKHKWLFNGEGVTPPKGRFEDSDDEKVDRQRISALSEIYFEAGIGGLIKLAREGRGQMVVGRLASQVSSLDESDMKKLICSALNEAAGEGQRQMENLVRGVLWGLDSVPRERILREFSGTEMFVKLLLLAPFRRETWELLDKLKEQEKTFYWKRVDPSTKPSDPVQLNESVRKLVEAGQPLKAAWLARYRAEKLEAGLILRLLETIAENENVPRDGFIEEAFEQLERKGEIPEEKIADLEFVFMEFLERSAKGAPNLENRINKHPEFFARIVELAYMHKGEHQEQNSDSDEMSCRRVRNARRFLGSLRQVPGRNESGEVDSKQLIKWILAAQAECRRSGQSDICFMCDNHIGRLLSKSLEGKDRVLPSEPVKDALEEVCNEDIAVGFRSGRLNPGVARVGLGSDMERENENRYKEWAKVIQYSHPKTSRILREIAHRYSERAKHNDELPEIIFRKSSLV